MLSCRAASVVGTPPRAKPRSGILPRVAEILFLAPSLSPTPPSAVSDPNRSNSLEPRRVSLSSWLSRTAPSVSKAPKPEQKAVDGQSSEIISSDSAAR